MSGLPAGWVQRESRSTGQTFYFAPATGESQWVRPERAAPEALGPDPHSSIGSGSTTEVRAAHILCKHRGSRRPSSWREENITRTKEEAIEIIKAYRAAVLSGEKAFEEIARTESDCSSAKRGGDLGTFGRGKMQAAFENAAFALKVNEVSDIVDSDSGIHIIKRLA